MILEDFNFQEYKGVGVHRFFEIFDLNRDKDKKYLFKYYQFYCSIIGIDWKKKKVQCEYRVVGYGSLHYEGFFIRDFDIFDKLNVPVVIGQDFEVFFLIVNEEKYIACDILTSSHIVMPEADALNVTWREENNKDGSFFPLSNEDLDEIEKLEKNFYYSMIKEKVNEINEHYNKINEIEIKFHKLRNK